jgi:outer membrane lipoprotein SlyB
MRLKVLLLPALLIPLAACEDLGSSNSGGSYANAGYVQPQATQLGRVIDARQVQVGGNNIDSTTGAVVGGLAGALVGNQFGKGSGNALATGVGAIGGAIAGSEIAKQNGGGGSYSTEWTVRLDDGQLVKFVQPVTGIRIGDRVRMIMVNGRWQFQI